QQGDEGLAVLDGFLEGFLGRFLGQDAVHHQAAAEAAQVGLDCRCRHEFSPKNEGPARAWSKRLNTINKWAACPRHSTLFHRWQRAFRRGKAVRGRKAGKEKARPKPGFWSSTISLISIRASAPPKDGSWPDGIWLPGCHPCSRRSGQWPQP